MIPDQEVREFFNSAPAPKPLILFIRVLETCNAGCFMCGFARSKDGYRFSASELEAMLPAARAEGIRYVRLTGGEPLVHKEIVPMVRTISDQDLLSSLITNGWFLPQRLPLLLEAGLNQIIVSIDGMRETHDRIRDMPGLFDRAVAGIEAASAAGIRVRVNTVCGPKNYRETPDLQELLTRLGVDQWELSSLKLERPLDWHPEDHAAVDIAVRAVYETGAANERLVPMGKVWCGAPGPERDRYFTSGIPPRADNQCLVVRQVRYLDPRNGFIYPCSLLPHRPTLASYPTAPPATIFTTNPSSLTQYADWLEVHGPAACTGCSSTAAGWSNALARGQGEEPWPF